MSDIAAVLGSCQAKEVGTPRVMYGILQQLCSDLMKQERCIPDRRVEGNPGEIRNVLGNLFYIACAII